MTSNKENTGDYNTGDCNTGSCNTGNYNTGNRNTGGCNTGDRNTGGRNTGGCNTGNYNTGDRNTGGCNTGNYNTGNYNTGDYNTGDYNTGFFNTNTPNLRIFNIDSELDHDHKIIINIKQIILNRIRELNYWVFESNMTKQEKEDNPTHKTTGGYLKTRDHKYCWKKGWEEMSDKEQQAFKDLPNFCPDIFEEITGINTKNKKKVTLELTEEQLDKIKNILNDD